jgi:hopanoid C-2 methylase
VDFRLPYDEVMATWRECMARASTPDAVYARFDYQARMTSPNQFKLPHSRQRSSIRNIRDGLQVLRRLIWKVGLGSDYRREFWKFVAAVTSRRDRDRPWCRRGRPPSHHVRPRSIEGAA